MRPRRLIVNADDLGFSESANQGIMRGFERGVVSSASLMVNMPATPQAVKLAKGHPKLGVGLHINLSCGQPLSAPQSIPTLVQDSGEFMPIGKLLLKLRLKQIKPSEVTQEIEAQFAKFIGFGIPCTHFDGHRHIHCVPQLFNLIVPIAKRFNIQKCRISLETESAASGWRGRFMSLSYFSQWLKNQLLKRWSTQCLRIAKQSGLRSPEGFFGVIAMSERRPTYNYLLDFFAAAPEGCSEIMCHPAISNAEGEWMEGYDSRKRAHELDLLISPATREAMHRKALELISYREL